MVPCFRQGRGRRRGTLGYRPRIQGDTCPVPNLLCTESVLAGSTSGAQYTGKGTKISIEATSWPPAVRVRMAGLAETRAETELSGAGPHLNRLKIAIATRRLARDKL